ncbi:PH domain-containing protein [Peribacillus simplex]|uniref:PH domain-containing protein n=3 Tax=Bacillaceae TaxID=186817 RepID=A0AA90PAS1_9BACI|nr:MULTISPECIES: PH domain-containing protein [Peribacillus]MDP1418210.1 PH domain-containing protein [Peribacillus simplex]MDP1451086.1 PH domain-containing protein [Peribacillus frigoritolerans]
MHSLMSLPQKRLSKDAIKVWMLSEMVTNLIAFIILGVLLYLDYRFSWKEWIGWILIWITAISVLGAVWSLISPFLLYKNWRFDADEEFLQLKSGVLNEVHELVPMTKIQSVATKQGPLLRKYGLCSVSIETMGSSHSIPALPKEVAIKLRNQIAQYAKIKEVVQ